MARSRIGSPKRNTDSHCGCRGNRTTRPAPAAEYDTLDGDELSRRMAAELGDALADPTIRPGCSGHHMEFPGTITVPPETLMDVIRSYCRSLDEDGFEHIVLVPTHGGNFGPVKTVAPDIARKLDATVISLADLDEHMQLLNEGLSEAGIEYNQDVIHAGAAETAIVLAIGDGLVRTDQIESGLEGDISPARLLSDGFKSITENGVLGDPAKATAEAGEVIIQNVVATYVEQVKHERDAV